MTLLLSNSCLLGSKDKVTIPTSNFPRLSVSDGQSSPASPSSVYLSTSETSPSSPSVTTANDFLGPGAGTLGQEHVRQPNRARGQQHSHHNHQGTTSPSSHTTKTSRGDSKAASPKKPSEDRYEVPEHSPSPRKTEQGYAGSLEEMNNKAPAQPDHRSSSPRKMEPQSPRRPAGQQPSTAHREGKDRRWKDEEAAYRSERGAAESQDRNTGTSERHRKNKRDRDASKPQTHKEKVASDSAALSRRADKDPNHTGSAEDVTRKDPRSSSSSIQDPNCNGTSTSKKAPITPGPWKVPSSARIQSQWETSYADI